jgi:hypothetical protein
VDANPCGRDRTRGRTGRHRGIRQFRTGPSRIRKEIVVCDAPERYSYILHSGLPVNDYRVDIELTPEFGGCTVRRQATFSPRVRGTGGILAAVMSRATRQALRGLLRVSET